MQVHHVKIQALTTDHLISKIWGNIYSDHLKYDLPQDEGDEYDLITFQLYFYNMTAKTGKYNGDQYLHAIYCDNDPTTIYFMYFNHNKLEATHALKVLPCIISEEILTNTTNFITRSGIEKYNMGIWDKYKRTFIDPNELHNEEAMEGMFEDTGITALYLDQDPQDALKNKMGNFDEEDIQKVYAWAQDHDDETVTIASRSRKIGRKLQERTKPAYTPGLNISPSEDPSITSGHTQEAAKDEDASLLGRSSLALVVAGDDISFLDDDTTSKGGDEYLPGY